MLSWLFMQPKSDVGEEKIVFATLNKPFVCSSHSAMRPKKNLADESFWYFFISGLWAIVSI
jgi:hypothetical protein